MLNSLLIQPENKIYDFIKERTKLDSLEVDIEPVKVYVKSSPFGGFLTNDGIHIPRKHFDLLNNNSYSPTAVHELSHNLHYSICKKYFNEEFKQNTLTFLLENTKKYNSLIKEDKLSSFHYFSSLNKKILESFAVTAQGRRMINTRFDCFLDLIFAAEIINLTKDSITNYLQKSLLLPSIAILALSLIYVKYKKKLSVYNSKIYPKWSKNFNSKDLEKLLVFSDGKTKPETTIELVKEYVLY